MLGVPRNPGWLRTRARRKNVCSMRGERKDRPRPPTIERAASVSAVGFIAGKNAYCRPCFARQEFAAFDRVVFGSEGAALLCFTCAGPLAEKPAWLR